MLIDHTLNPPAWLITFSTYGSWLHGDPRGSVDRSHNAFSEPHLRPTQGRWIRASDRLANAPYALGPRERHAVAAAIEEVCAHRGWCLHALNIRVRHLHAVPMGDAAGMRMLADFKAYATRRLVREGLVPPDARVWTRGGSARLLRTLPSLEAACRYVQEEQGAALPMCG